MESHAVMTLPPEPRSVGAAREFVRLACVAAGFGEQVASDALLLTSELVTNAVVHGRSELCIEVAVEGARLHVAVSDDNSRLPVLVPQDSGALDGRGLVLVRALACEWGVHLRAGSKAVWFELTGD